ncbi:MAG: RodZ domain-containing protein [Pseudomonadota bacterium]
MSESDSGSANLRTPGPLLRAAREQLNIEIREIGEALHLPAGSIEAIERDDYDEFPATVFARGYVRSYAKLVELDPDEVLAGFPGGSPAVTETGEALQTVTTGSSPAVGGGSGEALRRVQRFYAELRFDYPRATPLVALALGLLLLLIIVLLVTGGDDPPATAEAAVAPALDTDTAPAQVSADDGQAPAAAASPFAALSQGTADGASVETPTPPAPLSEVENGDSKENPSEALEAVVPQVEPVPVSTLTEPDAEPLPATARRLGPGDERLTMRFTADCWVEIRSIERRMLFSALSTADSELELVGTGPFNILLGYAPGASLEFNGQAVSLAPHTRNNVARLVVGQ